MREITAGVLGAGRIGRLHAGNLLAMPGVRLKSIVDPYADLDPWKAASVAVARDPAAILEDEEIEAVLVCSPTTSHADLTDAAAAAGKHVFCEKPIDLDPDRVRATLAAVEQAGVKLQVGFNRRFDPTFSRVREAIADGSIGEVQLIKITSRDPGPPPIAYIESSGGMFLDMSIHDFDMARFLSGSEVVEVQAFGAALVDPALAVIENSRQAIFGYDQRLEVLGSKGGVEALNELPAQVRLRTDRGVRGEKPLHFFLERYQRSFVTELEAFFDSVREGREPPVGGRDGLVSLLVSLAAQRSMVENRPVQVESESHSGSGRA